MIRLNNTPNEGSTVKVNLGFRDSSGQYYIPAKITYTFLALNSDKESWSIVDDTYLKPLTPSSHVMLTIPNVKTITGTTLSRKVMVYWDAFVDNEYSSFTDEITFDIAPKPFVPDEPVNPPLPSEVYVQVSDVSLQVGTLVAAPVLPVFMLKMNLPVNIDNAVANITGGDLIVPCNISVNESGGTVTLNTDLSLNYLTSYTLRVEGLVSLINGYVMKEPFELTFVTCREDTPPYIPVIQDKREFLVEEEGTFTVEPDEGYDVMRTVEVTVDLPVMDKKTVDVTSNGRVEVNPDAEFLAMKKVVVDVNVPGGGKPEQTKEIIVTENGSTSILPDEGYVLGAVNLTTEVPVPEIEFNKPASINVSEYTTPVHIVSDKDGMKQATVTLTNIPYPKEEQEKEITVTENGVTTVEPDSGKVLNKVTVNTHVPSAPEIQEKEITVTENNSTEIVEPDSGYLLNKVTVNTAIPVDGTKNVSIDVKGYTDPVSVTPDTGYESMEGAVVALTNFPEAETKSVTITENGTTTVTPDTKDYLSSVEVTTAIPLEENRTETLTSNGEHEVLPTSGNTAMKKATVTVAVPIESNRTETIEHNGTVTISPTSGYAGLEDVDVTVAVPLESNKAVTLTSNGEHEVTPTAGNDGMQKATVTVAVPIESGKTETISHNGTTTISPSTGYDGLEDVEVTVNVPIESGKTETIEHNGTVTISPSTGYDGLEDVEVTVAVPLEDNKQETIDLEDYSAPVEVMPSTGNDGMEKVTVTLTNMTRLYVWKDPNASPNPHYMYTTYSDTSKSDGHAYQCGTTKNALLTRKNVEVNGDALYVSGYPASLYYRDPGNDMQF